MSQSDTTPKPKSWIARSRRALLILGPMIVLVGAAAFYLLTGRYVSTDDAYVQSARVDVSTDVAGRIAEIDVRDNQFVHKGDVLFHLNQAPFLIVVSDATAALAGARLKVPALKADYRQRLADQAAARTALDFRSRELQRQTELQTEGISSRAQLDQAKTNVDAAQQQLAASVQQTASALAELGGDANVDENNLPAVRQAQAVLDHANLELSYTIVHAPIDGIVTKVDQIETGDHVDAAKPLFALMSGNNLWVEANYKETDLTYMRPGQPASFTVDAYPGRTFHGEVVSASPGTGSSFSLLPPENSSGNWVKVVQRLPVRISITDADAKLPLAAGMSVEASVDTGHKRSLAFWN